MKNTKIKICDTIIHPGENVNLAMPLPQLYSCAPLFMPIEVFHGKKSGPCVIVFSVLKGSELNGLEIANRLSTDIKKMEISGTLIIIPVVNVYGLTHYPAVTSLGDMENCFPGDEHGTYGERIAAILTEEIIKKADYCIELQTGGMNHNILPQVYCDFENENSRKLAKLFNTPVITKAVIKPGSLRSVTEELNIPLLVYQAGEAMRFDEGAIQLGVQGIKNILKNLDILEKEPIKLINPIFSKDEEWIIAHNGGILNTEVTLGQIIKKNQVIGRITDPFGPEKAVKIKSPIEGIVGGVNTTPIIFEGMSIFKVLSFIDNEKAESVIEEWEQKQPGNYTS